MALNLAAFQARRPEFQNVDGSLLQAALDDAAKRLSPAVFGVRYDEAHMWLAAHLCASAPWGAAARLQGTTDGSTVYSAALERLSREVGFGFGIT